MADLSSVELTSPWSRVALVHDDSSVFAPETMDALDRRFALPERLSEQNLSDTIDAFGRQLFVPQDAGVRGGVGGESHGGGTSANSPIAHSPTEPMTWAQILSEGAFNYVYNAGIGTSSIAQFLSRTDRGMVNVEAANLDFFVYLSGTYEANPANNISLATYQQGIREVVRRCRAAGIRPVIGTTFPSISSGAMRQRVDLQNAWLRVWCPANGVDLFDTFTPLVNPATGEIKTALRDASGVHANEAGNKVLGQALADLLRRFLPKWSPPLAAHQTADSLNMLPNALFLTDATADGVPDGWSESVANAADIITGDSSILGNWLRVTDQGVAGSVQVSLNNGSIVGGTSSWAIGDRVAVCGIFKHVKGTSGKSLTIQVGFQNGTPNSIRPVSTWTENTDRGVFYAEDVISPGTIGISLAVIRNTGTAGDGYSQLAQVMLVNLTKRESLAL